MKRPGLVIGFLFGVLCAMLAWCGRDGARAQAQPRQTDEPQRAAEPQQAADGDNMAADNFPPIAVDRVSIPKPARANSRFFFGPKLVNGSLYVLATVGGNREVDSTKPQFWKSTDNGQTWVALPTIQPGTPWTDSGGQGGGTYCFCWDTHGPFPNKVFFYAITNTAGGVVLAAQLFTYDLTTETWGTPFATVGFPQQGLGKGLIALSDGRIKLFYAIPATGALDYAVANTAGSLAWDSIDNVILAGSGALTRFVWSVAVDSSDRCHILYDQDLAPTFKTYINQDSTEVAGAPITIVRDRHGTSPNQISVLNSTLYVPSAGNEQSLDSVELYTGTPLDVPVFTRELVHNYPVGAVAFQDPYLAAIDYVGNSLTIMAAIDSLTEQNTIYRTIDYYQQKAVGDWSQGTYINLTLTPPGGFTPDPSVKWFPEDISFAPIPSAIFGMGIITNLDVLVGRSPSSDVMTFYLFGPAPDVKPPQGGGGKFFIPWWNAWDCCLQVDGVMWDRFNQLRRYVEGPPTRGSVPVSGRPQRRQRG